MRGRILWAVLITAAILAACSKKDSLYIEPGKAGPPSKAKPAEPLDEDEDTGEDAVTDDVQVAPPSGPMSLYRTTLNGPYSLSPALIVRVVDGAAVWIPGPPALPL